MNDQRCDTCRFWELLPEAHQETADEGDEYGLCRRFPPVLDSSHLARLDREEANMERFDAVSWNFPVVTRSDWCGEYQAKGE